MKYLIDHYGVKFVVTGSSNYYLRNLFPESLSGRKFLFNLNPLSFSEFLYFRDEKKLEEVNFEKNIEEIAKRSSLFEHKRFESAYESYLEHSGFPEVVVTENIENKKMILVNIYKSFFEKDARREIRDLLLLLVSRVGSMLDVSKISLELGVSREKIYRYLEYLQGVFVIKLVPKYSKSVDRTVAGGKKIYFTDTGLLKTMGDVNTGQLFENAVVSQLAEYGNLSFFNKRNTAEIDVIVDKKWAIEIKTRGTAKDVEKVKKLAGKLKIEKSWVVSKDFSEGEGILSPIGI